MTQDVDIQLQVWKDLAISKQILMGAATDALGLDAECSTEELKEALNKAIQRARDADINIQQTRSQAANREVALKRFVALLQGALKEKPTRKRTKVSVAAKQRRLDEKRPRSRLRQERSSRINLED